MDVNKIAIIGHCFGGLCALDLARAVPMGILGAISLHAPLGAPEISEQEKITASIMVLHSWEDPVAKTENFLQFTEEMTKANGDWQVHVYGHAKHAFTFVGADIRMIGIKYNEKAHLRSNKSVSEFLKEIFNR